MSTATIEDTAVPAHTNAEPITHGYNYEPCEASEVPTRPRGISPGRPGNNPHAGIMAELAHTEGSLKFLIPDVTDDEEREKLINRHFRYLRLAANANGRSVRVGSQKVGDGLLQIFVTDVAARPRKPKDVPEPDPEGSDE